MFGSERDDDFLNDPARAEFRGRSSGTWMLLMVIVLGQGAFLAWANTFEIEEVTRGTGRVVPAQQVQIVQTLDAGIVRGIEVRLQAEVALDREPEFPDEVRRRAPDAVLAEMDVLTSRAEQLDAELASGRGAEASPE